VKLLILMNVIRRCPGCDPGNHGRPQDGVHESDQTSHVSRWFGARSAVSDSGVCPRRAGCPFTSSIATVIAAEDIRMENNVLRLHRPLRETEDPRKARMVPDGPIRGPCGGKCSSPGSYLGHPTIAAVHHRGQMNLRACEWRPDRGSVVTAGRLIAEEVSEAMNDCRLVC